MSLRVCATPGCPRLTQHGRCPEHTRAIDKARGTKRERGYGSEHDAERRRWAPIVATGRVDCARCGRRIGAADAWHLDHDDDRTGYRGPSHALCNVQAGGKTAHR